MNTTTTAVGTWSETTMASLHQVWTRFINLLPQVLAAALVLLLGWLVARLIASLLRTVGHKLKLDDAAERTGLPERIRRGGLHFSLSGFLASLGFWLVMLVTLTVIADTMRWTMLGNFLRSIVAYTPNVLVAMVILAVGFSFSRIVHDLTEGGVRAAGMPGTASETVAAIARISVIVFSVMAAMTQLGVAADLVKILFAGIVVAAALGVGLAFGLGGRDQAQRFLDRMTRDLSGAGRGSDLPPPSGQAPPMPSPPYPRSAAGQ